MITFSYNPLSRGGELDKGNMEGFVPLPPPFVHPKMASLFHSLALGEAKREGWVPALSSSLVLTSQIFCKDHFLVSNLPLAKAKRT